MKRPLYRKPVLFSLVTHEDKNIELRYRVYLNNRLYKLGA